MMTGARVLAEMLSGYGVSHFFFMPVIAPEAYPEFDRLGIKTVMAHSEKGAAYMADGYGRVSGRVAVCGSQSVGALNLAAGLQDAYLGCSPVVALTGRLPQYQQQRNAYQEVDHMGPFDAVTKYNIGVSSAEELPLFLRQAIREATSGTPGPAHLDLWGIAGDEVVNSVEVDIEAVVETVFGQVPAVRSGPEAASVKAAIRELKNAERPIIVAGGGVRSSGAGGELLELAECLHVPVITSLNAKDTFPYDHPLAVGTSGQYSRECANKALAEADLVFFIGSHAGGQVTNEWKLPRPGTRIIQLDINAAELGRSFPVAVGMLGDARTGLRKLIENIAGDENDLLTERRSVWLKRVQQLVLAWQKDVAVRATSEDLPMRPERLCRELTQILPEDSVLVSDTGHAGIWTGTMMDLVSPNQSFIRCAGSLGWALPAAIGAKCAVPSRPVICFTGDGGMWYHLTELNTAATHGIKTITIVNNNASLNQEQALNERNYRGRSADSDKHWKLTDADFALIAETMGCSGIRVNKPSELQGALERSLTDKRPSVIDVKTHIEGIAPTAWN